MPILSNFLRLFSRLFSPLLSTLFASFGVAAAPILAAAEYRHSLSFSLTSVCLTARGDRLWQASNNNLSLLLPCDGGRRRRSHRFLCSFCQPRCLAAVLSGHLFSWPLLPPPPSSPSLGPRPTFPLFCSFLLLLPSTSSASASVFLYFPYLLFCSECVSVTSKLLSKHSGSICCRILVVSVTYQVAVLWPAFFH